MRRDTPRVMFLNDEGKDYCEAEVEAVGDGYLTITCPADQISHHVTRTDVEQDPYLRLMKRNEPRMPNPMYPFDEGCCQICGEPADDEMGEFGLPDWDGMTSSSVYAHGQCGLDHNLPIA